LRELYHFFFFFKTELITSREISAWAAVDDLIDRPAVGSNHQAAVS
jgi:hypothetical protein